MSGICLIVGAGEINTEKLHEMPSDFVIAADGGLTALKTAGIAPDLIMGDFDSLGETPEGDNVITVAAEKDDTDMMLAVKKALSLGYKSIVICGGTGGRFDHTFANIQTLTYIAERDAQGYLIGTRSVSTVIKNGSLRLPARQGGYVSVFSMGQQARGVYLTGLKYPLTNATVTYDFPIGVSNEFTGSEAEIRVDDGVLLITLEGADHNPKEHCYTKK